MMRSVPGVRHPAAGGVLVAALAAGLAAAPQTGAQGVPRSPASPAAPAAPGQPGAAAGQGVQQLSLALLQVSAAARAPEALVLDLGGSLLAVTPRGHGASAADVSRLAALLVDGLRGRELPLELRDGLAAGLAASLLGPPQAAVDAALADVAEALRRAGVGAPGILLIEAELRRLATTRR
jgi:hypothetical protein